MGYMGHGSLKGSVHVDATLLQAGLQTGERGEGENAHPADLQEKKEVCIHSARL